MTSSNYKQLFSILVIVAALGYFVDIYDLLLFSIVRIPSLRSMGVSEGEMLNQGEFLIRVQMAGLLVGGIIWGIMGDKRGRLSVLFGSILLYSLANIANGFAANVNQYALLRFIAGIGLAGELGAGITLVSESLPTKLRGHGTTLVATVGLMGAVLANYVAKVFDWQVAYFIGGGLGLILLVARVSVFESGFFLNQVQPMFAKMALPLLGGAPAVWNTALVFFQAALLLGYVYAHFLGTRLPLKAQVAVHLAVLAAAFLFLPVAIGDAWRAPPGAAPVPWLIGLLAVSVGLPFFALSATSPLLQRWFGETAHDSARDPYFLYGASNLGSLLALVAYPLLLEPSLALADQSGLWTFAYVVLAIAIGAAGCMAPTSP